MPDVLVGAGQRVGSRDLLKTAALFLFDGVGATLETLVDGVTLNNDQTGKKLKFLRRIPIDPMTNSTEWGMNPRSL